MNKYPFSGKNNNDDRKNRQRDKFVRTNWRIKAYECRIVEDGKPPRIVRTSEALDYAQGLGLDLVEISYDYKSGVSTCKVCDYGKYQYEQKQREKAAKKQARANQPDLKTLQMSLTTDTADLDRMVSRAKEFLENGDKVKISLRFRGRRELSNIELGKDIMKSVLSNFDGLAVLDSLPTLNGKELSCILRKGQPRKSVQPEPRSVQPTGNQSAQNIHITVK